MKPWTGKKICNVPGDDRVFMTYVEYIGAANVYRATKNLPPLWVSERYESHTFVGQRSGRMPSDHERYLEPTVAPLQAKQRLDSLESWLSDNQTGGK